MAAISAIRGVGLGLKRELIPQIQAMYGQPEIATIQFLEIAPENWINAGGKSAVDFAWLQARYALVCHGLCLSLGGPDPLNIPFLKQVKHFLSANQIPLYTEHLSYCSDIQQGESGYLYDLLPIPFTEEAVHYVAGRIRHTQDILEQRIAIENTSYYVAAPIATMDEITFLNAVLTEADCDLHLDVNNVYVNSINFGFDAKSFLRQIPPARVVYGHIAGHLQVSPRLLVDTHGAAVIDPVWELLDLAYDLFDVFPTLLERDTNMPPLATILQEVDHIHAVQVKHQSKAHLALC